MLIITFYKSLNGSGCYPVVTSHHDHQGSQSSNQCSHLVCLTSASQHSAFKYLQLRTFRLRSHSIVALQSDGNLVFTVHAVCYGVLRGAGWPPRVAEMRVPAFAGRVREPGLLYGAGAGWTCCGAGAGCTWWGCGAGARWEILCADNWMLSQSTWTQSAQKSLNTWMY